MVTLSVGQAILLLIDRYKNNQSIIADLKQLYIQGIALPMELKKIEQLFEESSLAKEYEISYSEKTIDEDVSRRYFETHLAFETLTDSLDKLDKNDIQKHYASLHSALPGDIKNKFNHYIDGTISPKDDSFAIEYSGVLLKIENHESYNSLSLDKKEKLTFLMKCAWLGVLHAKMPDVPLNLYGTGFFSEQNRGRIIKQKPELPTSNFFAQKLPYYSNHFGLMKNYMPVPRNDIIYAEHGFTFLKPSDQNTYNPKAEWPQKNFSALVHPFSCSISGTILCQLRLMIKLHSQDQLLFESQEQFCNFLKCFTSGLLFNGGGHSYNEFLSVLEIPEIRKSFTFIEGFAQINAKTLLLNGNERAFDKALEDTIAYTKVILARDTMHHLLLKTVTL